MSIHANLRVGAKRKSRNKRGWNKADLSAGIMAEIPLSGPRGTRGYPI